MRYLSSKLVVIISATFLSGCATSYKRIQPTTLNYNSQFSKNGIDLSYKYDVLREKGNKKYAKKEEKKAVKIVAIKISNNTGDEISVARDLDFFVGQNKVFPLEPQVAQGLIKQHALAYLPYALLTFTNLTITKSTAYSYSQNVYPIGLGIGPGVTGGNMALASISNKKLLNELYEFDILNRVIKNGETVYGLIGVRSTDFGPISVEVKNKNSNLSLKKDK
jgi:hypothetical protein